LFKVYDLRKNSMKANGRQLDSQRNGPPIDNMYLKAEGHKPETPAQRKIAGVFMQPLYDPPKNVSLV
jgi:hypothetical protein